MKNIVIIDNYDSFTYNIYQAVKRLVHTNVDVIRNNKFKLSEIEKYSNIIISPGPGIPKEAGLTMDVIKKYSATKSILGICLGHQAIAECFGAEIYNCGKIIHGKAETTNILEPENIIFKNLSSQIETGRYHSWSVKNTNIPSCLKVIATDNKGEIMAIAHQQYKVWGLQFHPESVLTPNGDIIIKNWINN